MNRYVGNAHRDGLATGGWFIGCFIDPDNARIRSTSAFEVKWCEHGWTAEADSVVVTFRSPSTS